VSGSILTTSPAPHSGASIRLLYGYVLRILGAVAVVAVHVASFGVLLFGKVKPLDWWGCNLVDSFSRWTVPAFIMLSGAFLLDTGRKEDEKTFSGSGARGSVFLSFFGRHFTSCGTRFITATGSVQCICSLTSWLENPIIICISCILWADCTYLRYQCGAGCR